MISAILTGTLSFSAFAEGFAAVIAVYSLCKSRDTDTAGRKDREHNTHIHRNKKGDKV